MFQLTFLGTSGSVPTVERGMPSLAVKYGSELLLWDCGEGTQRQLMRYKVGYGSISAIFISHPHLDHYLGMFGLLETLKLSSASPKKLPVFFPGTSEWLGRYPFAAPEKLRAGEAYRTADFSVDAFRVKHCKDSFAFALMEKEKVKFHEDKAHALGLKGRMFREIQQKGSVKTPNGTVKLADISWVKPGRKVVYGGDCLPDDNIIEAARGADVLVHEATFDASRKEEAAERMHSTSADAALVAKRAGVKKLILTHISPRYADIKELLGQAISVFPATEMAYDGMKVDVI